MKSSLKTWESPKVILLNISFTNGTKFNDPVEGADPNRPPCSRPNPPTQCMGPS